MRDDSFPLEKPAPRPLVRAILYLIGLGGFFYASYNFANDHAGARPYVPSIVYGWERAVPFLAWTIIPYWTTNLFYAGSVLLCRTRKELDTHALRLLAAQVIAIACFLTFPLQFSWAKPETHGLTGALFAALVSFDKPFNQAPSLHVALTIILWDFYHKILPRSGFWIFALWSLLVILSVMTTYQHHFIDIPTGLLLGFGCVWLFPDRGPAPWRNADPTHDPHRLRLAGCYAAACVFCVLLAAWLGGGGLWLLWPALALGLVALAYAALGTALFGKQPDGTLPYPTRWLLAPYLAGARLNALFWTRHDPGPVEVWPGVHLSRFPSAKAAGGFAEVIDLTAEFSGPRFAGAWHCVPMLDLVAPEPAALVSAAAAIERAVQAGDGRALVCCALGYGRSVAALAVWLTRTHRVADLDAALRLLKAKRPRLALGADQLAATTRAVHEAAP